jgi:hypothetical protein
MMSNVVKPGAGVLFMKVGIHAQEPLDQIIERKLKEIDRAGYALWGYGGNTCHPTTMVQPFANSFAERAEPIHLCMEEMVSNHFGESLSAAECSADGTNWERIPNEIDVRGSRYALVIEQLHEDRFLLPLERTRVPVGPSSGRLGSRYVKGKVDKACLEVMPEAERVNEEDRNERSIRFVATLRAPYAVFLRNFR